MKDLQSITLEKAHYPTPDSAIAFLAAKGVVADELIEFEEVWRVEFAEMSGAIRAENIDTGAIAVYQKAAEMEDEAEAVEGGMFPNPTPAELKRIQKFAPKGITYTAEELVVIELYASDNFVQRSNEAWSVNCLEQMAKSYPGEQLIIDHDWWDSTGAMGLVFDAAIELSDPTPEILNKFGHQKANRKIVKEDGLQRLKLKVFIEADHPSVKEIKYRRLYDLSTGAIWKSAPDRLCPHCVDDEGQKLSLWSEDCKHMPPLPWLVFYEKDNPEYNFASHILIDGDIYSTEISTVVVGDIPAAAIA